MTTSSRTRLSILAAAAALLLAGAAPPAGAVTLDNGFTGQPFLDTTLPGTKSAIRPELAGTVLVDLDTPFTLGDISGTVQNRVVRETASGTLDFYWRVILDPTSTAGGITALRLDDFGYANLTDADYRIDGLGTDIATTARLFNPATHPEGAVNFLLDSPLGANESSNFFFLHTDATAFAETAVYDLIAGNDLSSLFQTFAPAVPEPAPAATLALGVMALAWLRGRRTRSRG